MKAPALFILASLAASTVVPATRDVIDSRRGSVRALRAAVESPHATMHELGLVHRAAVPRQEEHEQRESFVSRIASSGIAGTRADSVITKPSILAPPTTAGFRGSIDNGVFPSDAAGAASARHLLSVTNASVVVQDRAGTRLADVSLGSFWHDSAYPDGSLYDPRAWHDAVADRWIICTLYDVNVKKSTLLIAVSDGSDPSLGWHRYRFLIDPNDALDADFTRMAMTRDSIVVTANMFNGDLFAGSQVFMIRRSDAYAAAATLPVAQIQAPPAIFDLVPAEGRDDALPYFVVGRGAVDLTIYSLNEGVFTNVGNPQAPALNLSNSSAVQELAPQFGTLLRISCEPIYVTNAVLRSGTLWVATHPYVISPLRSSVMWWRIAMGSPLRVDTGLVDDPTGDTMYSFPSIAVNKLGAALLSYSVFSSSIYPSAGYSYIDPLLNLSAPAILKNGEKVSPDSRWADFSTTVVDANDIDFWTTQTYESTVSTHWATWWGKIEVPATAPRRRAVHP
jgi:hypothetical protein